jgi:hypothetical protein
MLIYISTSTHRLINTSQAYQQIRFVDNNVDNNGVITDSNTTYIVRDEGNMNTNIQVPGKSFIDTSTKCE